MQGAVYEYKDVKFSDVEIQKMQGRGQGMVSVGGQKTDWKQSLQAAPALREVTLIKRETQLIQNYQNTN